MGLKVYYYLIIANMQPKLPRIIQTESCEKLLVEICTQLSTGHALPSDFKFIYLRFEDEICEAAKKLNEKKQSKKSTPRILVCCDVLKGECRWNYLIKCVLKLAKERCVRMNLIISFNLILYNFRSRNIYLTKRHSHWGVP